MHIDMIRDNIQDCCKEIERLIEYDDPANHVDIEHPLTVACIYLDPTAPNKFVAISRNSALVGAIAVQEIAKGNL